MRIKNLFTIPTDEKVTEKALRRVLISSICSILLCMTCLVSTTWAWFAVGIENTGNVIEIGTPGVVLKDGDTELNSDDQLGVGTHTIHIAHANDPDVFDKKSTLYVTLTIQTNGGSTTVYTTLDDGNSYSAVINIDNRTGPDCTLNWIVSWFAPVNAVALTDDTITLNIDNIEEPSTDNTTDSTTAPTQDTTNEPSTEAVTEPSTETTTVPTTEPSADATTAPTEESSPEETTAMPPETNPTENGATEETDPSVETTASTESTTESTGEADNGV